MSDYVLSCCASCDLNPDWMKKRDIPYAFFNVTLDGLSVKDDMGLSFSPRELLKRMEEGADAKTSQVRRKIILTERSSLLILWLHLQDTDS